MKVGDLMPLISAFTFNISSILNVGRTINLFIDFYDEAKYAYNAII